MSDLPDDKVVDLVEGMRLAITEFDSGQLALDRLAWALKSRIAALRGLADDEWVDELRALWNQLEYLNAFFIDSGRPTLMPEERDEVADALGELRAALIAY